MTDDFAPLRLAAEALAERVAAPERRKLARKLAGQLRRTQAARIGDQQNPDGSDFAPRKAQEPKPEPGRGGRARRKAGRIKRRAAKRAMFVRLKAAAFLRGSATPDEAAVGFGDRRATRIARVHQEGLVDQVNRGRDRPVYAYPARQLLGFTDAEREALAGAVLEHLRP